MALPASALRRSCLAVLLASGCITQTSDDMASGFTAPRPPARPAGLAFIVQPSDAIAGLSIAPAVQVAVVDSSGTRVRDASATVTVTILNPVQATLFGTRAQHTVHGIATFADLSINRAREDAKNAYVLVASAPFLASDTSRGFLVRPSRPVALRASISAPSVRAGVPFTWYVWAVDSTGNYVANPGLLVTVTLSTNPAGGALSGTTTRRFEDYYATFDSLVIDVPGPGYTLTATAAGVAASSSPVFAVQP